MVEATWFQLFLFAHVGETKKIFLALFTVEKYLFTYSASSRFSKIHFFNGLL